MIIEQVEGEWIVRVPGAVVQALGLDAGFPVTLRPLYCRADATRVSMAQMRDRTPEYTFDRADWDGVSVMQVNDDAIELTPARERHTAI